MILLPAIDLHEGKCVRLFRGDYDTAEVVAQDPLSTAKRFQEQGARWLHMVDLDGAKDGKPQNQQLIFDVVENTDLHVEVGGGIRDMDTVEYYLDRGVSRVILGSAALRDPEFVRQAVKRHGKQIAVGIDALDGKVAAEGWLEQSQVDYVDFAKEMESLGVQYLICTDIHQDGTMNGPNLVMLDKLNRAVHCHIIASGGVSSLLDIVSLYDLGLYGRHRREVFVHRRPGSAHRHHRLPQDFRQKRRRGICPRTSWTCTLPSPICSPPSSRTMTPMKC